MYKLLQPILWRSLVVSSRGGIVCGTSVAIHEYAFLLSGHEWERSIEFHGTLVYVFPFDRLGFARRGIGGVEAQAVRRHSGRKK